MKIKWWKFWKWEKELALKDQEWSDHCACLSQEIIKLKEELKTLRSAYFERDKENMRLESLLNPKRDLPSKRDRKI